MSILRTIVLLMLAMLPYMNVCAASPDSFVLQSTEWNVPRTTQAVINMPAIYQAIKRYEETPLATLQLRYAGGDEGTLWANELRSWLVALGIAYQHIELFPGATEPGQLELRVFSSPLRSPAGN